MRISKRYWLWGLFPSAEKVFLNEIKAKVQSKLKSPFFETHITLTGPYLNIDNIFNLIPNSEEFSAGKDVVYIVGLSRLVIMAFSYNSELISLSKLSIRLRGFQFICNLNCSLHLSQNRLFD